MLKPLVGPLRWLYRGLCRLHWYNKEGKAMWTIFGSMLTDVGETTYGRACQRNGLVYRWVFHNGGFRAEAYLNGYKVS